MKPIRFLMVLLLLAMNAIIHAQTIIPGGYVSGIWNSSNSPYYIQDNILVHPDSTLIIEEGSTLLFSGKKLLEIQGQMLISGTDQHPVILDGVTDTTSWYGLFINTTDTSITDSSVISNLSISQCNGHPAITITQSDRVRLTACNIHDNESFRGAGISCINSDPIFDDLLVSFNHALDGGGISLDSSSPVMSNCILTQNTAAGAGGAIVIFNSSNPVLEHCSITDNQSNGSGGGIYINSSGPLFKNCIISGNEGAIGGSNLYSGGGVSVKLGSNTEFENCIFKDNLSHREGGGIASFSENEIINCLFQENYAMLRGGGAFLSSGNLIVSHLTNCTFSDNESPQGTALATHNHDGVLRNCILWHSNPSNPTSLIYLDSNFGLNVMNAGYSDIQNGEDGIETSGTADYIWSQGNINLDPKFLPDTCDLSWQSPCIEAGTPDTTGLSLPELDLAGNPRLVNTRVDMGAYEYQLPVGVQSAKFKIQSGVRVFPNPAGDYVCIDFDCQISSARFRIVNSEGVVVKELESGQGNFIKIDINELRPGIYRLVIEETAGVSVNYPLIKY